MHYQVNSAAFNNKYRCRDCKEYKDSEDMFFEDLCLVCFEIKADEEANRKYDAGREK